MFSSSFIPETYAFETFVRSKSARPMKPNNQHPDRDSMIKLCLQFVKYYIVRFIISEHLASVEVHRRTIRQQYDRMNQSILSSSFLSSFDCGTSPHTKCLTRLQADVAVIMILVPSRV